MTSSPPFLGHVATYRYLVNGQYTLVHVSQSGDPDNWDDRTWEFFGERGVHLNDGNVWHVDNGDGDVLVPTRQLVFDYIVKPNAVKREVMA